MNDDFNSKLDKTVDAFIIKWCGDYAPHLIDTDDNDGTKLKADLISLIKSDVVGEDSTTSNGVPLDQLTPEAQLDPWLPLHVENRLRNKQRAIVDGEKS